MKVAQVLYSGLGGHAAVAFSLASQAAAARAGGESPDLAFSLLFVGIEPVPDAYARRCDALQLPHVSILTRAGQAVRYWPAIFRSLRRMAPDAVLLHSVKTILPCAAYARLHRVPLVAVEHQNNALKTRREWRVSRLLMRLADVVVVLTDAYRDDLRAGLGNAWRDGKVHRIANGIDTARFRFRPREPAAGPHRFGMAARMTPGKRQDVLIDALALLRQASPDRDWRLSLAGSGPLEPALREHAAHAGVADAVDFPGMLDDAGLAAWMDTLDSYAHATDGETLSTAILQAMATGVPVIGSDVRGVADLLAHGCGIACPPTAAGFSTALETMARDPASAQAQAARAHRILSTDYDERAMFERYRNLLEAVCRSA